MANEFNIRLDDKPNLARLLNKDRSAFSEIVKTFVDLMEVAAEKQWYELPAAVHTSLSFNDIVSGVLSAVMTTKDLSPTAYATLENDLHPLALISDKRKNLITRESEVYDWKSHFSMDSNEVSKESLEKIIRKILYLVRWFDVETISKALIANQFPIIEGNDIQKLPFQPALVYQKTHMGDLYVGKFLHDIGAFDCGEIEDENWCPACKIGYLEYPEHIDKHAICPRCNAGFVISDPIEF